MIHTSKKCPATLTVLSIVLIFIIAGAAVAYFYYFNHSEHKNPINALPLVINTWEFENAAKSGKR